MNKGELVSRVAARADITSKEAAALVSAFMESVKEALASGESVPIVGFGTFMVRQREERMGRNPRTREEVLIPACKIPAFKAGKTLKAGINS